MKVAILVMATSDEPSVSNCKAMNDTFIKYIKDNKDSLNNSYDCYFYYADKGKFNTLQPTITTDRGNDVYDTCCNVEESVYRTFEKTVYMLNSIDDYDWYVRINISTFVNIKLLDLMLSKLDESIIYCNAINTIISDEEYMNTLYPRGDFYIMSNKMKTSLLPEMNKLIFSDTKLQHSERCNVIHVDDTLFGVALVKTFGNDYLDMLKMVKYNFLPGDNITGSTKLAIASRVKTIPPGVVYSGYSWDDNPYRREDGNKMKMLYDAMLLYDYKDIKLEDIFVDEDNCRPGIASVLYSMKIKNIKHLIRSKAEKEGK